MRTSLLKQVPALGRRLSASDRAEACDAVSVGMVEVGAGQWQPPSREPPGQIAYLIADGVLTREVCVRRDWSVELLGRGDVLRPWLEDASSFAVARWSVLEPARLAIVDTTAATAIARFPRLFEELIDRALQRSRSLAVHAAIEGVHRIDERLLLLLWHIAERHGTVGDDEVVIPIRLTHEHLSRLVGARRPSVTTALGELTKRGELRRQADGRWVLCGSAPEPAVID